MLSVLTIRSVCSNVFSPITAKNLSNVAIIVQGNLHLPQNITYVQCVPLQ